MKSIACQCKSGQFPPQRELTCRKLVGTRIFLFNSVCVCVLHFCTFSHVERKIFPLYFFFHTSIVSRISWVLVVVAKKLIFFFRMNSLSIFIVVIRSKILADFVQFTFKAGIPSSFDFQIFSQSTLKHSKIITVQQLQYKEGYSKRLFMCLWGSQQRVSHGRNEGKTMFKEVGEQVRGKGLH